MPEQDTGSTIGGKAGRFVRAARLAGQAAARELEKKPVAPPATPPASPPPVQIAPQSEAPGQPEAARPRRASRRRRRRPEPAPNRIFDGAIYFLWVVSFDSAAFAAVQADLFIPKGTIRTSVQLAMAAVFLIEGWLLTTDWSQARERLLIRLVRGKKRQRVPARGSWRAWLSRLGQEVLILFGIAWIALGLWVALRGLLGGTL